MRVAMYYSNNDVRVEDMAVPKIVQGELLVKVMASGICGTDVLEWYRIKKAPRVLGHEMTGQIVEVGQGVEGYKAGDKVFVSHHVPCDKCRYCLNGHQSVCRTLQNTNYYPGGFAEYVRVPKINVKKGVFILPRELSFEEGTFIEPLACVIRGQNKAGLKKGQSLLILGSGVSGLLHLMLARAKGAGPIITTDISDYRLDVSRRLGADAVINANENVAEKLREINCGRLADLVIVCTGATSAFTQALECVDRAGAILFFASTVPNVEIPVPIEKFWRNEIKMMTSYANAPSDARTAIGLLSSGDMPVSTLITHRLSMEEAGAGFRLVAGARESLKVIIEPYR